MLYNFVIVTSYLSIFTNIIVVLIVGVAIFDRCDNQSANSNKCNNH